MNRDTRPTQEQLEDRRLMAITPLTTAIVPYNGGQMLKVAGTIGNDTITLGYDGTSYTVATATGWTKSFTGPFSAIRIAGGKGNDRITVDSALSTQTFLYGEDGNDTLTGGAGDDFLYAGGGVNYLYGGAGRDTLVTLGNGTSDNLTGGDGEDFFWADNKTTEKIYDADVFENGHTVNRITAFETAKFVTGTTKTQVVTTSIGGQRFRDPDATSKAYVYKRFDNRPLFADNGPTADDIKQGQTGDCYFLSTLSAVANTTPETIRDMVTDLGDGTYAVRFKNSSGVNKFYRVDNDLAVFNANSTTPAYAGFGTAGSMWVAITEKAFAYFRQNKGTYASISSGWMTEAFNALGVRNAAEKWNFDAANADEYLDWVQAKLAEGETVTMAVLTRNDSLNLVGGHAYTVVRIDTLEDGTRQLVVRNPWAMDGYFCTDGVNDGYVRLNANGALTGIDAFVAAKAA